jgi:hypothetical protein
VTTGQTENWSDPGSPFWTPDAAYAAAVAYGRRCQLVFACIAPHDWLLNPRSWPRPSPTCRRYSRCTGSWRDTAAPVKCCLRDADVLWHALRSLRRASGERDTRLTTGAAHPLLLWTTAPGPAHLSLPDRAPSAVPSSRAALLPQAATAGAGCSSMVPSHPGFPYATRSLSTQSGAPAGPNPALRRTRS